MKFESLRIPKNMRHGIAPLSRSRSAEVIIHGGDTETYKGEPMTLQFFSDQLGYETCMWVDTHTATDGFIDWLDSLPRYCTHLLYVHNLAFDLPEFFWSCKEKLITPDRRFAINISDYIIEGVYGAPTFAIIRSTMRNIRVYILDSMLWFQSSLAAAAKIVCPHLPKLTRPKDLGQKKYDMHDDIYYAYAMRDAEVAYHCGVSIQTIVDTYEISTPVSLADMSGKIFRTHFLSRTIPAPTNMLTNISLESYHGGKNNVLPDAYPSWHYDMQGIDISSAYPYAMSHLPSMSVGDNYRRYCGNRGIRRVPDLGVYRVSGKVDRCDYPCIYDATFAPLEGKIEHIPLQGLEVNEGIRSGELKISAIKGHVYDVDKDAYNSPFAKFVNYFYREKQTARDPIQRYMYKILLNSLYGKFVQTRDDCIYDYTDTDTLKTVSTKHRLAGGMFAPFIASYITAHTRVYMHQVEHTHSAIHTATDGIFTAEKKIKKVPMMAPKNQGLGALEYEFSGADVVLIRGKCYIVYSDDGTIPSYFFAGKKIKKYAKHGFGGSLKNLEECVAKGVREYTIYRPNKLRESIRRGLRVNDFEPRKMKLKIGEIKTKKA